MRGLAGGAATLASIAGDGRALLAVVDCMSCMRSKRAGPQHKRGLVRGIQLKELQGSFHRHSSQMDWQCWQRSDVQKAFAARGEVLSE